MNGWDELYGCDGTSGHVPGLLRTLAGPDPVAWRSAYTRLFNHLCHQGTVMEAAAAVVPFLVRLIDEPATLGRASLAGMLTAVAVSDHRDDRLPFDVDAAYPEAGNITDEQVRLLVRWLVDGSPEDVDGSPEEPVEDFYWDRSGPDRWARDAYLAVAARATTVARWVGDADPDVAALAAALLAWLPPAPDTVAALLAVPDGAARASANLALAHVPVDGSGAGGPGVGGSGVGGSAVDGSAVDRRLRELLAASDERVALTAAIALAHRHGAATPEPALTMLAVAADHARPLPDDVPGWDFRALRGFVAIALARIGW